MPAKALDDLRPSPRGDNFGLGPVRCDCGGAASEDLLRPITTANGPCEPTPQQTLFSNSLATVSSPELVQYQSFGGVFYDMTAWQGEHVALLVPVEAELDPQVMANLLTAFDRGWEYYAGITGREPIPHYTYNGRGTIAVVEETCGAGCGFLGFTGIEIMYDFFGAGLEGPFPGVVGVYDEMAQNQEVSQIIFYELGRNFWFYGNQLGDWGFTTGYAVVNRFYAMENSGFALADGDSRTYHEEHLPVIAATYFRDGTLTAENTLAQNLGVANPTGFNGAPDLAASLLRIFREQAGASDYSSFWQALVSAPLATTAAESFANFTATAEQVSFLDFSFLFKTGWSFQVGSAAGEEILAVAAPTGRNAVLGLGGDDILRGSEGGETLLGDYGDDSLLGNGGDDQLGGGAGNDTLVGGAGHDVLHGADANDRLSGGAGTDLLRGGLGADSFQDSKSGLNGDTITDFSDDDKIVITDATLAGFSFNLSGGTLTYSGGMLTLTGFTGVLVARAAADGGVELTVNDARNDFNGDGRSDILWRNVDGTVTNWLGQPNGGFVGNKPNINVDVSDGWKVQGIGDFNGDGRDDILLRNVNGIVIDWLGQENGGFASNAANLNIDVSDGWKVQGVGDFNGDGRDDILWRNVNGIVIDWLGQDNGGFTSNAANLNTDVSDGWQVQGIGDFNGDGRDDILWRNSNGIVIDWLGQDNGGFISNSANLNIDVSDGWQVQGIGDFNGDGRDDILWRNNNGVVINWLGQENGGFAGNAANLYADVNDAWHIQAIGDYNGDGHDDLMWRNDNGIVMNWLGQDNGGFTSNAANIYIDVTDDWRIQSPDLLV